MVIWAQVPNILYFWHTIVLFQRAYKYTSKESSANTWEWFEGKQLLTRGGSRTAAISKMELFVIIVNGFQLLTIITKCSILDVTAILDPPLVFIAWRPFSFQNTRMQWKWQCNGYIFNFMNYWRTCISN